jgi:hypothetical protein
MDARDLIDDPTSILTAGPPGVVYMFKVRSLPYQLAAGIRSKVE